MKCPLDQKELKKAVFYGTEVDYCPHCLGIWFEKNELIDIKDEKIKDLNWLDIDLWNDRKKFEISKKKKECPACQVPLYEVNYGDSQIKVDVCDLCLGLWLDRGEFQRVIDYLEKEGSREILNNYFGTLIRETAEIFSGPESLEDEIADVLTVIRLLKHKLAVQYPEITGIISNLPK